jgi:putative transposase
MVHELPGTTFSNPTERGDYDSDTTAYLTLGELERWLALAIAGRYHHEVHDGIPRTAPTSRPPVPGRSARASACSSIARPWPG